MLRLLLTVVAGGFLAPLTGGLFTASITAFTSATTLIYCAFLLFMVLNQIYCSGEKGSALLRRILLLNIATVAVLMLLQHYGTGRDPLLTLLNNCALLGAAGSGGLLLSKGLKRPSELIPVCVVAAWADICSLSAGPTQKIASQIEAFYKAGQQGPPPVADFLLIKALAPGSARPWPLFGVTDWVFVAFLAAALMQLELPAGPRLLPGRQIRLPVAPTGLLVALIVAHISGLFVPGLVFICGGVLLWGLICEPRCRKLSRREWLMTAVFPLVITAGVVLM